MSIPEEVEDLGHTYLACADCGAELVDIWSLEKTNKITKVKAICENEGCGGESWVKEIIGEFYIGCSNVSILVSIDQDDDLKSVKIHARSI